MKKYFNPRQGFTLVEMMVATSLFIIVVTISMGAILSIFEANRKAQASKTVMDNLNLALEDMARTVRFGTNHHCENTGTLSQPRNCSNNVSGSNFLAVNFKGQTIVYRRSGNTIQRSNNGGASYTDITSPQNIVIESLTFRVFGTSQSDYFQPYVLVVIKGYSGNPNRPSKSTFSIQTIMSQRKLDIQL